MHNDSMEGTVLGGRYQLQERIGVGGMSVVYRALDTQTDSVVGIKTLKEEYCSDVEFVRRFLNEIKATAGLQHPNIVKIYDQGEEDGMPFIVMEFIEGITLKDYIVALQTVKWRDALNITAQVLSAVACAHEHKVIHRDIKPQNIMITDAGQIKLTDFGIARVVSSSTKQAKPDSAGSVHYLSPEQARGGFVDERSDIYSIGIMLYEMVTGVVPFDGESHVSIALKHIDGHIVPPHTVDPDIPRGVSDLIMMATNKNPLQRFQSAEEMYDRMKKVAENPKYAFLTAEPVIDPELPEEAEERLEEAEVPAANQRAAYMRDRAEIVRSITMTVIAYLVAAVVGIVSIVFVIARYQDLKQNMSAFSNIHYQIADYTGLQADAVVQSLTEKGIKVQKIPVESDLFPVGYVVGQNLKEGTLVEERTVLELEIASLNGSFVLEDFAGDDYREVGANLTAQGIKVSYSPLSSGKYKEQSVVRTSPEAGSFLVSGDSVVIYYSSGTLSTKVSVPKLSGMTLEEAQKALEKVGLRLGTVYPEPGSDITDLVNGVQQMAVLQATQASASPTTTAGPSPSPSPEQVFASDTVIAQYPTAGTKVYEHETVNLYFCATDLLETSKELTVERPKDMNKKQCDVLIECATFGSTGRALVLFNETVKKEEFPVTVDVPFAHYGAPVRVTVYIDGEVYQEIVLYA